MTITGISQSTLLVSLSYVNTLDQLLFKHVITYESTSKIYDGRWQILQTESILRYLNGDSVS